jgi:hypothetical protein
MNRNLDCGAGDAASLTELVGGHSHLIGDKTPILNSSTST